jgi:hypothetical protein
MKLRNLNFSIAMAVASCAWATQADTIVYEFSFGGELYSYNTQARAPATIEGTLTLQENPTASNYTNFNGFMNLKEYLSWSLSPSLVNMEYKVMDEAGEVLAESVIGLSNFYTYTTFAPSQHLSMSSSGFSISASTSDTSYIMPSLSNDPETGQTLSDAFDLLKVAEQVNAFVQVCIPGEPYEFLPGVWITPCTGASFSSSSWTITGNDSTPQPDADGDGINDAEPLVLIAGLETDVPNYMLPDGVTSLSQGIAAKLEESAALGVEVSSYMAAYLNELKDAGVITGKEKGKLQSAISKSKGK